MAYIRLQIKDKCSKYLKARSKKYYKKQSNKIIRNFDKTEKPIINKYKGFVS